MQSNLAKQSQAKPNQVKQSQSFLIQAKPPVHVKLSKVISHFKKVKASPSKSSMLPSDKQS